MYDAQTISSPLTKLTRVPWLAEDPGLFSPELEAAPNNIAYSPCILDQPLHGADLGPDFVAPASYLVTLSGNFSCNAEPIQELDFSQSLPPLNDFAPFDDIMACGPLQLLLLQANQNDFICGVDKGDAVCCQSLYCQHHSLPQRLAVRRSRLLSSLARMEMDQRRHFERQRYLVGLYHECKAYWAAHQSLPGSPASCVLSSCDKKLSEPASPRCVSSSSQHPRSEEQRSYLLLREAFIKNLSILPNSEKAVSYILYCILDYATIGEDIRAREIEARFHLTSDLTSLGL